MHDVTRITGFALVLGFYLSLTGCARSPADVAAPAPIPISVSYPIERYVTDHADFTGRTASVDSVEVRARVWGYLDKVNFKEGSLVKKGDLLYVIDQRPFRTELNRAKARLEEAKANVTQSTANLVQAQAQESKAVASLDYARRRFERTKGLAARNVATKDELELHQSELDQAQAELDRAKAQIAASRAAIVTTKAAVETAAAAVGIAELNLDYTRILAPISGRVSRTLVTEGNLVQSADQAGGALLTTIVSVDPIYAYFDVDERTVLRVRQLIREGKAKSARDSELPVSAALANEDGYPHRGTVNFVDNQVNPKTGTLRVRGVFPSSKEILSPGYFIRVRVPIGFPHQALLVTDRAIDNDQGQKILYVVNEKNEVVSRPIRTGALHDGGRVIEEGLKPGERVVVNGLQQVRPAIIVEPKVVEMPLSPVARGIAAAVNAPTLPEGDR